MHVSCSNLSREQCTRVKNRGVAETGVRHVNKNPEGTRAMTGSRIRRRKRLGHVRRCVLNVERTSSCVQPVTVPIRALGCLGTRVLSQACLHTRRNAKLRQKGKFPVLCLCCSCSFGTSSLLSGRLKLGTECRIDPRGYKFQLSVWSRLDSEVGKMKILVLCSLLLVVSRHLFCRANASESTGGGRLVINEVNAHQPGPDMGDFVELRWVTSARPGTQNRSLEQALDDFVIVLYDGRSRRSYRTISLSNRHTNRLGLFLVGPPQLSPQPDIITDGAFLQNGDQLDNPDAVALYNASANQFPTGTLATSVGLVDAVVYSRFGPRGDRFLETVLSPSSGLVHELEGTDNGDNVDLAISRCAVNKSIHESYILSLPTPGVPNNCTPYLIPGQGLAPCPGFSTAPRPVSLAATQISIVINEINSDNPFIDTAEFVELYDGGRGNTSLLGVTIVFFDGTLPGNQAYGAIDLSQYSTDMYGYFTIGSELVSPAPHLVICDHFIANGPDAIALYSSALDNNSLSQQVWSNSSVPSLSGLLDAVVYSRGGTMDHELVGALVPGQNQLRERLTSSRSDNTEVSLSRCTTALRLRQDAFVLAIPTPGFDNNCSMASQSPSLLNVVLISEVYPKITGGFIELTDGGIGLTSLAGVHVLLGDEIGIDIDLSCHNTDWNGYLVVGPSPNADVRTNESLFSNEGSVSLVVTQYGMMLDSVRFETDRNISGFNETESLLVPPEFSVSRCFSQQDTSISAFATSLPTEGKPNRCGSVSLSEISGSIATSTGPLSTAKFIELYDGGSGFTPLAQYQLVHDNSTEQMSLSLANFVTDASGYFTLSDGPVFSSHSVLDKSVLVPYLAPGRLYFIRNPGNNIVSEFNSTTAAVDLPAGQSLSVCRNVSHERTVVSRPTAGLPNDCGLKVRYPSQSSVLINEVDANQPFGPDIGEFVELYDGGKENASLDGLQLVVFRGLPTPRIDSAYSLLGHQTRSNGYFLIGLSTCSCFPDLVLDSRSLLPNRASAIALFQIPPAWIIVGSTTLPPAEYLVDAVVYSARASPTRPPQSLLNYLLRGQEQLQEDLHLSLARCYSNTSFHQAAFANATATPGSANICPALTTQPSSTTERSTSAPDTSTSSSLRRPTSRAGVTTEDKSRSDRLSSGKKFT